MASRALMLFQDNQFTETHRPLRRSKIKSLENGKINKKLKLKKNSNKIARRMTVVHLIDDCLEMVLLELNLVDLAKAAHANVHLAKIAANVFARKYHQQEIELRIKGRLSKLYNTITCYEASMIIEHFGKHITKLRVDFMLFCSSQYVLDTISEHCCNTLLELTIGNAPRSLLEFRKPFVKLEKLAFSECLFQFDKPMDQLNIWFPNLRSFELQNVRYAFESFALEQHMPSLQHFGYYTFPYVEFTAENMETIGRIIALNPQLKSFGTYYNVDSRPITQEMLSIPLHGIETFEAIPSLNVSNGPFQLASLKNLLLLGGGELNAGWLEMASQIERLELLRCEMDDRILDFISQCTNLNTLKIIVDKTIDMDVIKQIANITQSLNEVYFAVCPNLYTSQHSGQSPALAAILVFMAQCTQLKKATVAFNVPESTKSHSKYKHSVYVESQQVIKSYRDTIERNHLISHKWRLNHQLRPVELIKGFDGYCQYLLFEVSFENTSFSDV